MKFHFIVMVFHGKISVSNLLIMEIMRLKQEILFELLDDYPAVAITGARQVGKTTLAKRISHQKNQDSEYLDLESPRDIARLQDAELYFDRNRDKLIILDEIQRMPELFPVLRSIIDKHRVPGRFLLLGSASPGLIRGTSESLAGRIAYEEMYPFLWEEINTHVNLENFWLRGGFPNSLLARSDKAANRWLKDFLFTYIERDLPLLGLNTDLSKLRNFLFMAGHQQGGLLNQENLARSVGVSASTISRYLDYLEHAYLIRIVRPWHLNVKKRLVKSPKIYIRDSGLLHAMMDITDTDHLYSNPIVGGSWEGFVIEQICGRLSKKFQLHFYRTHQGAEADILITHQKKPVLTADIKLSEAPKLNKGFLNVIEDNKTDHNFIIIPGEDRYPVHKKVDVIGIETFLEWLTEFKI